MFRLFWAIALLFLFLSGCNDKKQAGFGTAANCNVVYDSCMSKCLREGKLSRDECSIKCEQSKGMCNAMKLKGCMGDCVKKHGKDTPSAEMCKKNCENILN